MDRLYKNFRALIKRHQWIAEKDRVLLGLSGGVDSMTLAHLLFRLHEELPFFLHVAHVNYGLRGKESDAQEEVAERFTREARLPFFCRRVDLKQETHSESNLQEKARGIRFSFFQELALECRLEKVFLAHHLEDQVETVLAHLLRGSSFRGVGGMRPVTPVGEGLSVVRPLLTISKTELIAFATRNKIPFIEDSSNTDPKFWRNRIRSELLPVVADLRPKAFEKITSFAEDCRAVSETLAGEGVAWLDRFARREGDSLRFPRLPLLTLPRLLRAEIFRMAVDRLGGCPNLQRDHLFRCDQISTGDNTGGMYLLPNGLQFLRDQDALLLKKKAYVTLKTNE